MTRFRNLTEMFRAACEHGGDRTAVRYHDGEQWCELSWSQYLSRVNCVAATLVASDYCRVEIGDGVAILSENCLDWLIADQALLAVGAITVPIHATATRAQIEYQLANAQCRGAFVSVALYSRLKKCETALEFTSILDAVDSTPTESTLADFADVGGDFLATGTYEQVLERSESVGPDDPATILYTSGTTGNPKGVVLTHGNLLANAEATFAGTDLAPDEVVLNWLPLSHVYARTCDHYLTTMAGMTLCLARSPETVVEDLAAIQPTWMNGVPRFYEKVWNSVRHLDPDGRRDALYSVFGGNVKQLSSGGAPLPVDVALGYFDAGIPLLEGYGLTESSPVIAFNAMSAYKLGSVGRPVPGVEVRIADDGEVLTRGPHVMPGYWNDPEATAEAIDPDGWLHTGDLGELDDDGYLFITGRKKELIVLSNGKNVVPNQVEAILGGDPLVEQSIVLGDDRPYCIALVVPNETRLAEEATELGVEPSPNDDVLECPPLVERLLERLETRQADLSPHERVRRVALLPQPFTTEAGDLTASFKLKRGAIAARLEHVVARLYEQ